MTLSSLIKTIIDCISNRNYLNRGQTPQAFRHSVIKKAYEIALQDPAFKTTDDCEIVVKYLPDIDVYVVPGEEKNIKLTYPEDINLLDKLFQLKATKVNNDINLPELKNIVIVVFDGNSGIGKDMLEIAQKYGAKGYPFSRSLNGVDITDLDSIKKALDSVYNREGRIDYVVNSAAILNKEPIMHLSQEKIVSTIYINYKGMVNITVAAYDYIVKTRGQILQFTSSSYTHGRAFYSLYSSTKAAVVNFVQAIAEEWERSEIRINCINPQRTRTPMRIANFGIEDEQTLLSKFTGEVIDIKVKDK